MSLFEAHTDVLVKDRRATYYDHKIFLTTGRWRHGCLLCQEAQAVVGGVIAEGELPPELLAVLASLIQFHRWEESARAAGEAADAAEQGEQRER